jgi:hypothetical protein
VEVVTGDFPTCWEMEVMDNGSAEDGEDENADIYARYVSSDHLIIAHELLNIFDVILAFGCRAQRWPWDLREATQGLRYVLSSPACGGPLRMLTRGGHNSFSLPKTQTT